MQVLNSIAIMSQYWPLSQELNKSSGVCSVCFATRQLHIKNNTVHLRGPRNNPCAGSNKQPLSIVTPRSASQPSSAASCEQPLNSANLPTINRTEETRVVGNILGSVIHSDILQHPNINGPIIKHVPKSARTSCATLLVEILKLIENNTNDINAWRLLLHFASSVFVKPNRTGQNSSLATVIKKKASEYLSKLPDTASPPIHSTHLSINSNDQLAKLITSKIEDGNVSAALRMLLSEDKLSEINDETFEKLQERHPMAPTNRRPTPSPPDHCLQVTESEVMAAIRSFPAGSAGGPDGLRPQHIADLVNCLDSGPTLLKHITAVINLLLQGKCALAAVPVLFGGNLTALSKPSGGVRPISVGYYWRRLAAKCANTHATTKLAPYFLPLQLGVGVKDGCEAAIHAGRRYVDAMPEDFIIAKLDFKNAFNSLRRDAMLEAIYMHVPEIFTFCHMAYTNDSILKFGNRQIMSQEGVQQGDPLGPLMFCLTIHPILQSLNSEFIIGYMDDVTLGGPPDIVAMDALTMETKGYDIGLYLNMEKSELITKCTTAINITPVDQFVHFNIDTATLLGAPLSTGAAMNSVLEKKLCDFKRASDRLQMISSHDALILMRASCSAPRLMHLLRSSPCAGHNTLPIIDNTLRSCLINITNVNINDEQWLQASLPVRAGGLGIRSVAAISSSAFLASVSSTRQFQTQLLANISFDALDNNFDNMCLIYRTESETAQLPMGNQAMKQRSWDQAVVEKSYQKLMASQTTEYHKARLLAASAAHSGDWLHALPISSCGLRLDDESVRVAVGLRLGASLCDPHYCLLPMWLAG